MAEIELIAEVGTNFDDAAHFEKIILMLAGQGITLIKGQYFAAHHFDNPAFGGRYRQYLEDRMLSVAQLRYLIQFAKNFGDSTLFFTPECALEVPDLEAAGQQVYKVSHVGSKDDALLEAVAATGKPAYVSLYEPYYDGVRMLRIFGSRWRKDVHPLWCVGEYPPRLEDLTLLTLANAYDGFSCHYPDPAIVHAAIGVWAASQRFGHPQSHSFTVEVHVTPDVNKDYVDNPVSFPITQVGRLKKECERIVRAIDGGD